MDNIKALYIVVNAGYAENVVDLARACGAGGATIINARGTGVNLKTFLGMSMESEKEIILSLVTEAVAEKIMSEVKEHHGIATHTHGVCFTLPVDKMTKIVKLEKQIEKESE